MSRLRGTLIAAVSLALLTWLLPTVAMAQDATLQATLTYVGPGPAETSIFRYDYTLTNNAVTPQIIELIVFFDSNPDNGVDFMGDLTDFNNTPGFSGSMTAPAGWIMDAFEDPDPNPWAVDFFTPTGLNAIRPGQSISGFSVTFLWKGSGLPGVQFYEALDGYAHEGQSTIIDIVLPPITGTITSACDGHPLAGVPVDLYNEFDVLIASTLTSLSGTYTFINLPPGNYTVSISTPIGYEEPGDHIATPGQPVNFSLQCMGEQYDPRTIGFWKHQVSVYLTGKGKAQISKLAFVGYLNAIYSHYAQSLVHPVSVYTVPTGATELQKLQAADLILGLNTSVPMEMRARQQLMAVLLNTVSLKLAQTRVVSLDGATASQAITYAWDLIADGNPANDEMAKTIADEINNGRKIPAGWIPLGTPNYTYSEPGVSLRELPGMTQLLPNAPNPVAAMGTDIRFRLAQDGAVRVSIFDIQGRVVRTLTEGFETAGEHTVHWDGRDARGSNLASGLYFYTLTSPDGTFTRKLVVAN
jgi:hypothetical protein